MPIERQCMIHRLKSSYSLKPTPKHAPECISKIARKEGKEEKEQEVNSKFANKFTYSADNMSGAHLIKTSQKKICIKSLQVLNQKGELLV